MSLWFKETDKLNEISISSRIRLARNLADLPFPGRMTSEVFTELKNRVKTAIEQICDHSDFKLKFIEMDDIPENEINSMVERHIISPDFAKRYSRRAIAISSDESISVMIGEEDHIRIQVIKAGQSLDEAYRIADELDSALNEKLRFAYNTELGFLTECPTNIGTGLRASIMLHLPLCESRGQMSAITDAAGKIGLTVRGMYGEGSKAVASLYQVSNQITLGISEKNAIENLKIIAEQIIDREKQERLAINRTELEDTVFRALGTLKFARLMSSEECMKLISLIKLGVSEGIIECEEIKPIEILIESQPYMLMRKYSVMNPGERDEARASMIRELLSNI